MLTSDSFSILKPYTSRKYEKSAYLALDCSPESYRLLPPFEFGTNMEKSRVIHHFIPLHCNLKHLQTYYIAS